MKHLLVCLLMLLAVPAAATTTSKTVTITITAPAGICSAPAPAPAVAAGLTTQVLCTDWTQAMPANWLGGCSVAGNGAGNNTNDNSGHNWYLNIWWSFTLQNCNTVQRADPAFGGTVLDMPWQPNSNEQQIGTVIQSSAWHSTDLTDTNQGFTFPNNTYYEITMRQTPLTQGSYAALFTWPVLAMTDSTNQSGLEIDDIEEDAGNLQNSDGALHNWGVSGVPGQWLWQGYCGTGAVPQRLPCNFDPNQYHTFGALSTSDGTTQSTCSYIDGVFQQCVPIPGGLTATEANARYFLIVQNACDWWNYPSNFCNGPKQDMYVKDVKAWSCPTWQTTQCRQPPPPTTINATDFCAANGGGDGSAGNPWQAACIQAAVNSAANGNTVFLAAGNWALNTTAFGAAGAVITSKSVNLSGAGSGNTFDAYGHPNNPMWNKTGTYTRVFTTGLNTGCNTNESSCHSSSPGPGGFIQFANCASNNNNTISHIFFDGSVVSAGGDSTATMNTNNCNGVNFNDIRVWAYECPGAPCNNPADASDPETQFFIFNTSNNTTVQNSIFEEPPVIVGGAYPGSQVFQVQFQSGMLIKNNMFYMFTANPFYMDNVVFTDNYTWMKPDALGGTNGLPVFGDPGCSNGGCFPGAISQTLGNFHFTVTNNIWDDDTNDNFVIGGGVNDPSTAGIINDINYTGNWVLGTVASIDSCEFHNPSNNACTMNTSGVSGMQINNIGNGFSFFVTNNSIIGSAQAWLNAEGTGCNAGGGSGPAGTCPAGQLNNTVVNYNAQKNYLASPNNRYINDAMTITPTVTGNFCSGSAGGAWCTTTGFTQAPTVTFTLGAASGGIVPFATTNFTAQYGAVKWLASTSSTTPTSGGQVGGATWAFIPPYSLAAASGNTIFMWVMDSANHISAPASAVVP